MKGTMEVHETEVRELRAPVRAAAPVLPRTDLAASAPAKGMFSDSLLEFGQQKTRRAAATTFSFVLNCLAIGIVVIVPLFFTEELPKAQLMTFLVAPPPPPPPPPPAADQVQRIVHQIQTDMLSTGQLRTPTKIPKNVQMIHEEEAPPPMSVTGSGFGVVGGTGMPGMGGVIGGIVGSASNVPKVTLAAPQRVRISQGVTKGLLIHRVEPTYPVLAKQARVQGEVVLSAVISTTGEIENLQLVSGHPMLVPSAIAAVRQWRYKPYLLNGAPVEVETTITVIFSLTS